MAKTFFDSSTFFSLFQPLWDTTCQKYVEENLNLHLSLEAKEKMFRYIEALLTSNQYMNLTALTRPEEVAWLHIVDSLCLEHALQTFFQKKAYEKKCLDVGTGAGFPGFLLQILFPKQSMVLLDSLEKRLKFIQVQAENLLVPKIETLHGRAEDWAKQAKYRGQFDLVFARALASLPTLLELCGAFLKEKAYFFAMKGRQAEEELRDSQYALKILGLKKVEEFHYTLPHKQEERKILVFQRLTPCPPAYPRRPSLPQEKPLLPKERT